LIVNVNIFKVAVLGSDSIDLWFLAKVGLGDSCNPTHSRKTSGYAIANPVSTELLLVPKLELGNQKG